MKPRLPIPLRTSPRHGSLQIPTQCLRNSSSNPASSSNELPTPTRDPRWLSDMKARLGKCIMFGGLDAPSISNAADALRILSTEWRSLVAGREGFLVDKKRAGLLRHKVVWGEQDSMSHVNNVTYVRWAESARVNWTNNYAVHFDPSHRREWAELSMPKGVGMILKSIRTDYKFSWFLMIEQPMTYPDHISVFHKLRSMPKATDSHFVLDVMIMSELRQRPAARCVEDIVVYDYKKGQKTPLPPFMMDAFRKTWEAQEAEKERVEERMKDVLSAVRSMEQRTWDRDGAVEDMGGTK
ncbi:hypothetical protein LARI1_G006646 [Lachnellula arida]|uniref:Thioesterase/thiol ester dehydrase-isomerase n=1 Tax=Lachnellula arida TaxID=1316785 RepID=A0A8T9BEL7_9HELO|nr:hypothetical protein LARI1_G006646 [Lachnellula arida]